MNRAKQKLLVLTSTYPRFDGDTIPDFVHQLNVRLVDDFEVIVLAPHCAGAKTKETMDGVKIHRFIYGPSSLEVLAYGSGMLEKIRSNSFVWILVPIYVLSQFFFALHYVLFGNVRLIHCHWIIPQGLTAIVLKWIFRSRINVLLTVHGGDYYGFVGRFPRLLKNRILKMVDNIAVVSNALRNDIVSEDNSVFNKINIAPMGVDLTNKFVSLSTSKREGILYVGRLVEKKGVTVLIDALYKLNKLGCKKCLKIVGSGSERDNLENKVKSLGLDGQVTFLGALPNCEVVEFYQAADVTVIPSIVASSGDREGLGLVAIEAIGAGAITIASDLPALKDIIQDGITGVSFRAGDSSDLALKLYSVFKNVGAARAKLSNGRTLIIDRFSWETSSSNYKRLLKGA